MVFQVARALTGAMKTALFPTVAFALSSLAFGCVQPGARDGANGEGGSASPEGGAGGQGGDSTAQGGAGRDSEGTDAGGGAGGDNQSVGGRGGVVGNAGTGGRVGGGGASGSGAGGTLGVGGSSGAGGTVGTGGTSGAGGMSRSVCGIAPNNDWVTLNCPSGKFSKVIFASFGTPTGTCGSFAISACHSPKSVQVITDSCIGKTTCMVRASSHYYDDPCFGTTKKLAVELACQ